MSRVIGTIGVCGLLGASGLSAIPGAARESAAEAARGVVVDGGFTEEFFLAGCTFDSRGGNAFFSLEPGYQLYLAGEDHGELVELYITVLRETRDVTIDVGGRLRTVRTRVIEERESVDGELFEISRNFYARCVETSDVFYFGEDVCFFENGECVGTGGSWLAGAGGAVPGIIMPGRFLLGSRYFQEQAPGVALDQAEHTAMGVALDVPAGHLEGCATVFETSGLEPQAHDEKIYAPGIGLVKDGAIELVRAGFVGRR
jgi:hypothetical protein